MVLLRGLNFSGVGGGSSHFKYIYCIFPSISLSIPQCSSHIGALCVSSLPLPVWSTPAYNKSYLRSPASRLWSSGAPVYNTSEFPISASCLVVPTHSLSPLAHAGSSVQLDTLPNLLCYQFFKYLVHSQHCCNMPLNAICPTWRLPHWWVERFVKAYGIPSCDRLWSKTTAVWVWIIVYVRVSW